MAITIDIAGIENGIINIDGEDIKASSVGQYVQITGAVDDRTCLVCMQYAGGIYRADDPEIQPFFGEGMHPQCRHFAEPVFTDRPDNDNMVERNLEGLSEKEQIKVIGKEKYKLLQEGKLEIQDLYRKDGTIKPLKEMDVKKAVAKPKPKPVIKKEAKPFAGANSIEEAEKWIKDNDIAENVLYSGGRRWGGKITDAKKLEKMNEVLREIDYLERTYNIKLPKVENFYITNMARGRAHCRLPANKASISFGNQWSDDVWKRIDKWEAENKRRWTCYFERNRTRGSVRHEYGHILDGDTGHKFRKNTSITQSDGFQNVKRSMKDVEITDYAKKDSQEWFAEGFTYYTSPKYGTKIAPKFPKQMEEYFEFILDHYRKV